MFGNSDKSSQTQANVLKTLTNAQKDWQIFKNSGKCLKTPSNV
jgi:hypothetical protein